MNLYLSRLPKKEDINSNYLNNLYSNKKAREGLSYKGHLAQNNMNFNSKNIYSPANLERKFQFNYIIRTFNFLINNNKKRANNSVENKNDSHKLYLPMIKEFEITNNNNKLKEEDFLHNIDKKENNIVNSMNSLKNMPLYENSENNNEEIVDKFSKSKNFFDKSNSTVSQSIINNKSYSSSKMFNDSEKNKTIFRNLSHGSIFEAYKKQYLSSVKEYKTRNIIAEKNFKEKLEKIKREKIKKSKDEELFKEYELKFNPEKFTQKLKNEFKFFQNERNCIKRKADEDETKRKKLFKDLKKNEDKKNCLSYYELKHGGIKPSQRIIQNMLRKEKKEEIYEQSLLDLKE